MNTPIFHPQNGECLGVVSELKITNHAIKKWKIRFSYLDFDEEIEHSVLATKSQKKAIKQACPQSYDKTASYLVSKAGCVFVIIDNHLITVMPLVESACSGNYKRNHRTKKFMKYN